MWQLENSTPFAAAANSIRDRDGAEVWVVVVRASFRVLPDGRTAVADEQDEPVLGARYMGKPGNSSLLYDSDFYLTKPTTDILLNGTAYAPGANPTTKVDVTMRVGDVRKTLRVTGDRVYQHGMFGLGVESPQPFVSMPITYERAFGGHAFEASAVPDRVKSEMRNPVGCGFAPMAGWPAPNIEYPGTTGDKLPAGFGPIPPHWYPRVGFAGTYNEVWRRDRLPLYPGDLDDRYFLCSPDDQRPKEFLRGGEPVELINLTSKGRQTFVLPRIVLSFETSFRGKQTVQHRGALHTVIIEPDISRVIMVWQSSLRVHTNISRLTQSRIRQLRVINAPPGSIPLGSAPIGEETDGG